MIIIKRMIRIFVPILYLIFLNGCAIKKDKTTQKINLSKCERIIDETTITVKDYYNEEVKENYLEFSSSNNKLEIFLIKTTYGYSVKQEYKRLFSANGYDYIFRDNNRTKKINYTDVSLLLKRLDKLTERNVSISCQEPSSSQHVNKMFVKKEGVIIFELIINNRVQNIDFNESNKELAFIRDFQKLKIIE